MRISCLKPELPQRRKISWKISAAKLPDYLPPRVFLMKMACAEHQDEDCTTRVQNILAQDPMNFDALFLDGSLNLAKGDADKAVREFEQLGSIYGQNPQVRYQLARAYLLYANSADARDSAGMLVDAAESSLNDAVKLDPHFDQATLLLAELKIRKGSPCRRRGFVGAVDQGTAADCSGAIPARLCLFGPTKEGPSLGGLPSDDGIVPERSSTLLPHGNHSAGRKASSRKLAKRSRNQSRFRRTICRR